MGYLVFKIKAGERVQIGNVEILIADTCSHHAKLAINAPREIKINRLEPLPEKAPPAEFKKPIVKEKI